MYSIVGTGSATPKLVIKNDDLAKIGDTNDEWIRTRTGILERRLLSGDEKVEDLALASVNEALNKAKVKGEEIDLIIVATFTPTNFTPNTACYIKRLIGAKNAVGFDINSACSGFVYGVWMAQGLMKANNYKNAIVIGAEGLSKVTNWEDRSTFVLFGDGAGAAVLQKNNEKGILSSVVHNFDDEGDLWVTGMDYCHPFDKHEESKPITKMNGGEVFKFATKAFEDILNELAEKANIKVSDIKYIVPHQANKRIIDFAAKKFDLPEDAFFVNIEKYGNTSAASVPLALNELYAEREVKKGDKIACIAFGGGLTAGGFLYEV